MKKFVMFMLALLPMFAMAQSNASLEGTIWTNGGQFFALKKVPGKANYYSGYGGSLHEGGIIFGLKGTADTYNIVNGDNGEPEGSEFYYSGQTLLLDIEGAVAKLRTIDGERCLLLYVGNELYDIYHEFIKAYKMETLYDLEAYLMLKTQLAGEYIDSKGDLVTFNADNRSVTGLFDDTKHFKVVEVYDMPSTILQFDETAYSFSHEDDGLLLTKMKCDTEDPESWEATEKTIRLYHVLPSQMKGTAGKSSRFDFASQSLLYKESLYGFTKSELKLMRNEIYARHGYQFSTPDMKEYFSKCPWYKPRGNNNAVVAELSEVEQLNIQLIKRVEKESETNE